MNKLKLTMDELRVESFRIDADEEARGTVNGHATQFNSSCDTCQNTTRVGACFCTEQLSCRCQ